MAKNASIGRFFVLAACLAFTTQALAQTENTIHRFNWPSDGTWPMATMAADNSGNLYGTTYMGGDNPGCGNVLGVPFGCGTVFELTPPVKAGENWSETILYSFTGGADGGNPAGGVVFDRAGNLYGMTGFDGSIGQGTIYQLQPPAIGSGPWTENTIYNFSNAPPGYGTPFYMTFDNSGNLYGYSTGYYGGIFELSPPAGGTGLWTYTQIHTFNGPPNDGGDPLGAPVFDASGNLYGTTNIGGSACSGNGCGTVFRLAPPAAPGGPWEETILYNFKGLPDGLYPASAVLIGKNGNLFGATPRGGANGSTYNGYGTVFELAKPKEAGHPWEESVLYSFESNNNGAGPEGALIQDARGNLYGTAPPVAFELSPPTTEGGTWTETGLYNFVDWPGLGEMVAGLTRRTATGNTLYGVTQGGGICNKNLCDGTVFSITP